MERWMLIAAAIGLFAVLGGVVLILTGFGDVIQTAATPAG